MGRSDGCGKGAGGRRLILPVVGPLADWEARAPKTHDWVQVAIPLALAVAACLIAIRVLGRIRTRRHLSRRISYDLLPTTTFSPSPEDILRFAAQLARARPQASRLIPRRASSIRVRWYTDDAGLLSMRVEGPANAASVLRHQTYANVEIRRAQDPEPDGESGTGDVGDAQSGSGKGDPSPTAAP